MNKSDVIAAIVEKTGYEKKVIENVLNNEQVIIKEAVANDEKVTYSGFVTYSRGVQKAKSGINNLTKKEYHTPEKFIPKAVVSKTWKAEVANIKM